MATGGNISNGVRIGYSAASPLSFTKLGEILNAGEVSLQVAKIDRTIHGSSPYTREMPGMITVQPISVTMSQDLNPATSATQQALFALAVAKTTVYWRFEEPSDRAQSAFAAFEFQGFVSNVTFSAGAPGDAQDMTVEITFDGNYFTKYAPAASQLT